MYAVVDIKSGTVVRTTFDVPFELAGLEQATLNDLGAALNPCPKEWAGLGVWPLTDEHQDVPEGKYRNVAHPTYVVHSATCTVTQTHRIEYIVLEERKRLMMQECKRQYYEDVKKGFKYNGAVFQIDDPARIRMTEVLSSLNAGEPSPHGGFWRDADNNNVSMSDAECSAFLKAARAHEMGLVRSTWSRCVAIKNAADHAALDKMGS